MAELTANERLAAVSLLGSLMLERLKSSIARELRERLRVLDNRFASEIIVLLEGLSPREMQLLVVQRYSTPKLRRFQNILERMETRSRSEFLQVVKTEAEEFAKAESEKMIETVNRIVVKEMPEAVPIGFVSATALATAISRQPIDADGKTLNESAREWASKKRAEALGQVRIGVMSGETPTEIGRRLRGTERLDQRDGALYRTREAAEKRMRTMMTGLASAVRGLAAKAAKPLMRGVMWNAVLDEKLCVSCASLHGKIFPIDEGLRPPAHPQCRCHVEMLLKFSKTPEVESVDDFLASQPIAVQKRILGKTRLKLWREGVKLGDRGFVDKTGRAMTIPELRDEYDQLFARLGI